jgi:hypothetical protein
MSATISETRAAEAAALDAQARAAALPSDASLEPGPEQVRYAKILERGMQLGLLLLVITFPLYLFGVLTPHVPLEKMPEYWTLDTHEYLEKAGVGTGWSWISLLGRGDYLNFAGIAILASVTVICYLSVIPLLIKRKDFVYALLAVVQVAILLLAASGILAVGH